VDADLLIVGGGITGLGVAVHAARRGLHVVLVEAGPLGGASTQRSGALVRTHYPDRESALLALAGLEDFENFEKRYGGPAGFEATGFVYVPDAGSVADGSFGSRVGMLESAGVETSLVDTDEVRRIDPAVDVADVGVAAYEPRSGYADPLQTTATLAAAARRAGADLRPFTRVTRLLADATGAVVGGGLDGVGRVSAATTVLCAGAHSRSLAAGVGVELAIRPTAVKIAFVGRRVPTHLTVIDAPNGTYLRPDGAGATLVGRRTWTDEPLDDVDDPLPAVDPDFLEEARTRLARRVPSAVGAPILGHRAGLLDMTPDGLAIVGPSRVDGLWLSCGWSGTGFKTGPSVGRALVEWLVSGTAPQTIANLHPAREMLEPGGVRSPH
jgi:sarcosine oxidase, subunit beta